MGCIQCPFKTVTVGTQIPEPLVETSKPVFTILSPLDSVTILWFAAIFASYLIEKEPDSSTISECAFGVKIHFLEGFHHQNLCDNFPHESVNCNVFDSLILYICSDDA